MKLEDIVRGDRLDGVVPGEPVGVLGLRQTGPDTVSLTYARPNGELKQVILYGADEQRLSTATAQSRPFDAPALDFRQVAEAPRIRLAGLYDPMLPVAGVDQG